MAVEKLSIGEVNSGPFEAIDSLVGRINTEDFASFTQAANVPQITGGESPTEAEFNALLTALKNAGLMAPDA